MKWLFSWHWSSAADHELHSCRVKTTSCTLENIPTAFRLIDIETSDLMLWLCFWRNDHATNSSFELKQKTAIQSLTRWKHYRKSHWKRLKKVSKSLLISISGTGLCCKSPLDYLALGRLFIIGCYIFLKTHFKVCFSFFEDLLNLGQIFFQHWALTQGYLSKKKCSRIPIIMSESYKSIFPFSRCKKCVTS